MAAVVVGEGGLEKALKKLGRIVMAEGIYTRGADSRRYRSRAEQRRLTKRHTVAKAKAKARG